MFFLTSANGRAEKEIFSKKKSERKVTTADDDACHAHKF
jgi:hypothetical protein